MTAGGLPVPGASIAGAGGTAARQWAAALPVQRGQGSPLVPLAGVLAGHTAGGGQGAGPLLVVAVLLVLVGLLLRGERGSGRAAGLLVGGLAVLVALWVGWWPAGAAAAFLVSTVVAGMATPDSAVRRFPAAPVLGCVRLASLVLLGAVGGEPADAAALAVPPLLFGAAVGMIEGACLWRGDRRSARLALWLLLAALLMPLAASLESGLSGWCALPFLMLMACRLLPDALWAVSDPRPASVTAALSSAHAAVFILFAALAAGFGGLLAGLGLLAVLPLSVLLERVGPAH